MNRCCVDGLWPKCMDNQNCDHFEKCHDDFGVEHCTYYWDGDFCSCLAAIRSAIDEDRGRKP
jgi:hypothetical protein